MFLHPFKCSKFQLSKFILKSRFLMTEVKERRNYLFNNALNTFYLRLYGVGHMVKNHSERKPAAGTTWASLSD